VRQGLLEIFEHTYRELRPGSFPPEIKIEFFAFANVNNTVRLREGKLFVRLSDLLEGAPESVLRAISHILLAKMYRKPIDRGQAARYRKYVASHEIVRKAHLVRQMRGRKRLHSPRGHVYDLEALFEDLNARFFHGLLARPRMSWSQSKTRRILGHYDPAHNAIIISRVFDHFAVPRYAVEYLSRDAASEASSEAARQPALRALCRVSGRGEAVSQAGGGECIFEEVVTNLRCAQLPAHLTGSPSAACEGRSLLDFPRVIAITTACADTD